MRARACSTSFPYSTPVKDRRRAEKFFEFANKARDHRAEGLVALCTIVRFPGCAQRQVMAGARGCVSVISSTLQRGSDAKTESVCDPQLVRRSPSNSSKKLRGAILDKTGTSATGRSFAAGEGKGGADLPADRESRRGPAERGAEPAHSSKCGVGFDNIDVAACTKRSVAATNTPGV